VKGSWTVPSVSCTSSTTYAAFWVGIDGFTSSTVEQTGVLDECYQGTAYYYAWYEFYPSASVYLTSQVPVKAGDVIYAEVSYASSKFTATLTDETTTKSYSVTVSVSGAKRSSAEWIAEAPSSCSRFSCFVLPLANFNIAYYGVDYTSIGFTSYATINSVTGPLNSFGSSVYELVMVTSSLTVKAQPSAITTDETSFTVTWKHS
jgi:hypothetical protein